ncbi:farmer isoform X2 [Haematobia irritans]|uniref:farmer isoform X2 n=1 Tax=Haematobia irritans TaxID=7368 RepID=UPI003F50739C
MDHLDHPDLQAPPDQDPQDLQAPPGQDPQDLQAQQDQDLQDLQAQQDQDLQAHHHQTRNIFHPSQKIPNSQHTRTMAICHQRVQQNATDKDKYSKTHTTTTTTTTTTTNQNYGNNKNSGLINEKTYVTSTKPITNTNTYTTNTNTNRDSGKVTTLTTTTTTNANKNTGYIAPQTGGYEKVVTTSTSSGSGGGGATVNGKVSTTTTTFNTNTNSFPGQGFRKDTVVEKVTGNYIANSGYINRAPEQKTQTYTQTQTTTANKTPTSSSTFTQTPTVTVTNIPSSGGYINRSPEQKTQTYTQTSKVTEAKTSTVVQNNNRGTEQKTQTYTQTPAVTVTKTTTTQTQNYNRVPEQKTTTYTTTQTVNKTPTLQTQNVITNTNSYKTQQNVTPRPTSPPFIKQTTDNYCPCLADKAHSSTSSTSYPSNPTKTTSSFSTNTNSNQFQQQFSTTGGFAGQTYFGGIMNSMALLQQIPVVPQVPGYPAFYPPDKIPKGAIVAFMPVIILPEAAHANCQENSNKQSFDPLPLGVQPAPIPFGSSLNSIFPTGAKKDQCMCPCSCTQNIPDHSHKKRDTAADDVPSQPITETKTEEIGSNAQASNNGGENEVAVPALIEKVEKDSKTETLSESGGGDQHVTAETTATNDTTIKTETTD